MKSQHPGNIQVKGSTHPQRDAPTFGARSSSCTKSVCPFPLFYVWYFIPCRLFILFLLELRPRITQRDGPVKHQFLRGRIGINAEIAEPFELETVPRFGVAERGFNHSRR